MFLCTVQASEPRIYIFFNSESNWIAHFSKILTGASAVALRKMQIHPKKSKYKQSSINLTKKKSRKSDKNMQEAKTYVICLSHIFFPGSNILILISRSNSTSSFNFWFNDYSKQSVTISLFPSTVVCSTGSDQISVVILSFSLKMIYHHLTLIMHVYSYSTTQTKKVLNLIT